jgi:hypothetical protein
MIPVLDRVLYLASPYTHDDPAVRSARAREVARVAGRLIASGRMVYSPISHGVPIEASGEMAGHYEAWRRHNRNMIARCNDFAVLALPGWRESTGIVGEALVALDLGCDVDVLVAGVDDLRVVGRVTWAGQPAHRVFARSTAAEESWIRARFADIPLP